MLTWQKILSPILMSALLWVSIIKIIIYRHYQLKTLPMYIRLLMTTRPLVVVYTIMCVYDFFVTFYTHYGCQDFPYLSTDHTIFMFALCVTVGLYWSVWYCEHGNTKCGVYTFVTLCVYTSARQPYRASSKQSLGLVAWKCMMCHWYTLFIHSTSKCSDMSHQKLVLFCKSM